jgi:TolB protein
MDVATVTRRPLEAIPAGNMTFAPRFSPDGNRVVFSLEQGGNSDIYMLDLATGQRTQLTNAPSIETAPSFSPDGSQIVFESDRTGTQQIYVMPASGGEAVSADQPGHGPLRHARSGARAATTSPSPSRRRGASISA